MDRVTVKPEILRWAYQRAGATIESLRERFPQLPKWESGEAKPTLKQLEHFARAVHIPIGYLFLPEPLIEHVPIPDFRTVASRQIERPSPDLLDTIYICQQRQEWYRDFARATGEEPLPFVGSADLSSDVVATAAGMRDAIGFDLDARGHMRTWTEALRDFIDQADALGVLVMVSGIVGSNTHRKLDPEEFRGFALADDYAPLVYINGADTKAAQMFTLAHELAHIWLGASAVSDAQASRLPEHDTERWCNQVAAEVLAPLATVREEYRKGEPLDEATARMARRFKVSTLVVLRRIHDAGGLTRDEFWQAYEDERERLQIVQAGNGGDFYRTTGARVSKRFARALVASTLEGQTLHRDAFRMLGVSKVETFHELGRRLGVA